MFLKIELSHSLIVEASKASAILEAISSGKFYERKGYYDSDYKELSADEAKGSAKVEFVHADCLKPSDPLISKVKEDSDRMRDYWLKESNEHKETKAALKKAQDELSSIRSALAPSDAPL